jgi:hypothetical protein
LFLNLGGAHRSARASMGRRRKRRVSKRKRPPRVPPARARKVAIASGPVTMILSLFLSRGELHGTRPAVFYTTRTRRRRQSGIWMDRSRWRQYGCAGLAGSPTVRCVWVVVGTRAVCQLRVVVPVWPSAEQPRCTVGWGSPVEVELGRRDRWKGGCAQLDCWLEQLPAMWLSRWVDAEGARRGAGLSCSAGGATVAVAPVTQHCCSTPQSNRFFGLVRTATTISIFGLVERTNASLYTNQLPCALSMLML